MTKENEINVPFDGYYESVYNYILDEITLERDDTGEPLDYELQPDNINYSAVREQINAIYIEEFNNTFKDETGIDLQLKYKCMESPKEYNYNTDRLFADIYLRVIGKLFAQAILHIEDFKDYIGNAFTPYDGFWPHYTNEITDWIEKPLNEYDHNEKATLLEILIEINCNRECFFNTIYEAVHERAICNGEVETVYYELVEEKQNDVN